MWRYGALTILAAIAAGAFAEDVTASWYPLHAGDTWVYRKEFRYGDMAHPSAERWTTEDTIVSAVAAPQWNGTLVTRRTKVLDHAVPPHFIVENDSTKRELPESHLLVRGNCVYVLDGSDAQAARARDLTKDLVPADFCFPLTPGSTWGQMSHTSPAKEYVWFVRGVNADPFGPGGVRTVHVSAHQSSGTEMDRWFAEGIGVVQEIIEHHGTHDEQRRQLLRSTIGGRTRNYDLPPARAVALFDADCEGGRWRHFARADGKVFASSRECLGFVKKTTLR